MKRHQQILAGVLILQIILGVITFWPRSAATGSSKPVFAELKAEDITALTITDDQGVSITMRKSGDGWVLPNAGDYPVQASKITPILEKLTKLNTASLVTRTEASYKQLKVSNDDFVRRIDFETADGKTYMLYLGSAPRYTATHFRVVGQTETYLTTELSTWQLYTAPASWVTSSKPPSQGSCAARRKAAASPNHIETPPKYGIGLVCTSRSRTIATALNRNANRRARPLSR